MVRAPARRPGDTPAALRFSFSVPNSDTSLPGETAPLPPDFSPPPGSLWAAPQPHRPWGKNPLRRGPCGLKAFRPNIPAPGGGAQGIPGAHTQDARTPKPAGINAITAPVSLCGFPTIPSRFFGCGTYGTGFQDYPDQRTPPNRLYDPGCGQHPLLWFVCRALHIHGKMALS